MRYKHIGSHAQDLPGGRVVAPGEFFEFDPSTDNDFMQDLLAQGVFIEAPEQARKPTTTRKEE